MAFGSSNRTAVRRTEETVLGVTPATPAFIDSRYTSESLNYSITNITSNEIRFDRQTADLTQTEADVAGAIDFELSYGSFDDMFAHAMADADGFSADYGISGSTAVAAVAGTGFSGVNFVTAGVTVGDWIRVSGMAAENNNGYFRATAVTTSTVDVEDSSGITGESAGAAVTIQGGKLVNGVAERSFAFEKEFGDAIADAANPTPPFLYFNGVRTCGFTLNMNVGEILTGSFNVQGTTASINDVEAITSISVSGNNYVRSSGSWVTDGFVVGMQVVGIGFTGDGNNKTTTVTAVSSTNLTVTAGALSTEGAGARTVRSLSPPRFAGATTVAANTNDVMNAVGNVAQVTADGVVSTSCFNSLTLTLDNNCYPIDCIGTLGHRDIKFGRLSVTGNIALFFENTLEYARFIKGESFSFAVHVEDIPGAGQTFGNAYTLNFPYAKFQTGQLNSEGLDTNITFAADFTCLIDREYPVGTGMTSDGTAFATLSITKYDAV